MEGTRLFIGYVYPLLDTRKAILFPRAFAPIRKLGRLRSIARRLTLIVAIGILALAATTAAASASTTVGSTCVANNPAPTGAILFDPLTETVPSTGVITKWGNVYPGGSGALTNYPQTMIVLTPTGANQFTVAYVGGTLDTAWGGNSANVNVPVKAGQIVATWGNPMSPVCTGPATVFKIVAAAIVPATGSTLNTTTSTASATVARYFVLEPDADLDGYGDESQDKCPQSAAAHIACPTPVVSAFKLSTAKSFKALVTCDIITTIDAVGTVKLPAAKGKKAKTLTLKSNTVATAPGTQQTITIKYPRALKSALAKLSHKKKLKIEVAITAKGVIQSTTKKLNGQLAGKK